MQLSVSRRHWEGGRFIGIAGGCIAAALTVALTGGCEMTYTRRVSGVYAGNGGSAGDLVLFSHSPVDGEQDAQESRMAMSRDSSRRDTALGSSGDGYVPLGWWEAPSAPQIDRPYWIQTSRSAETWVVPRRQDDRRRPNPYWTR